MDVDTLEGRWLQLRGRAREWWGRLTEDDLDRIEGKRERLVGLLQERYGFAPYSAEIEVERRIRAYEAVAAVMDAESVSVQRA